MYIDSLTIAAIVVFVIALVMFVKNCLINSCILASDRKASNKGSARVGGK